MGCYTFWGEWLLTFRRAVIPLYLVSNSISAEDEGFNIYRNVGNHNTVAEVSSRGDLHFLGRVVSGVSEDRNTFVCNFKQYFS